VVAGKPLVPTPPVSSDPGAVRLRELLAAQRRALLHHDPGVRVGDDPENLHQHRVAARRTRSFLRATRASLDPVWRDRLREGLRELGSVTGPVRDLDVMLEHLREELRSLESVDRAAGEQLLDVLGREHAAARRTLLDTLESDGYRRLLRRLAAPPAL